MDQPIALQLFTEHDGDPRLVVFDFEIDESCASASIRDIIEGPRPFIERYIKSNYKDAPIYVRNGRPNKGEVLLVPTRDASLDSIIILPTVGLSARKVYDLLLHTEASPPPTFHDVMPKLETQVIMDKVLSGEMAGLTEVGRTHVWGPDKVTFKRSELGLEISVENDEGAWMYFLHSNSYMRVR